MVINKDYPLMEDEGNYLRLIKKENPEIKKPTLIDVGCGVGDFTYAFLNMFPDAECMLIDPLADSIRICKEKFKDNKKISYFNFALGENKEEKMFYDSKTDTGCSSFYDRAIYNDIRKNNSSDYVTTYKVKIETLDSIFKNKEIFYLKLDVEGYEHNVIKGAKKLLRKNLIKYIQFEYGICMSDERIESNNVIPLLYDKYDILNGDYKKLPKEYNENPIDIFTRLPSGVENFLAIRKEK